MASKRDPGEGVWYVMIAFAAAWYLLIGGIAVAGTPIPVWLLALTGFLQGGSLLALGYLLRGSPEPDRRAERVAG